MTSLPMGKAILAMTVGCLGNTGSLCGIPDFFNYVAHIKAIFGGVFMADILQSSLATITVAVIHSYQYVERSPESPGSPQRCLKSRFLEL